MISLLKKKKKRKEKRERERAWYPSHVIFTQICQSNYQTNLLACVVYKSKWFIDCIWKWKTIACIRGRPIKSLRPILSRNGRWWWIIYRRHLWLEKWSFLFFFSFLFNQDLNLINPITLLSNLGTKIVNIKNNNKNNKCIRQKYLK